MTAATPHRANDAHAGAAPRRTPRERTDGVDARLAGREKAGGGLVAGEGADAPSQGVLELAHECDQLGVILQARLECGAFALVEAVEDVEAGEFFQLCVHILGSPRVVSKVEQASPYPGLDGPDRILEEPRDLDVGHPREKCELEGPPVQGRGLGERAAQALRVLAGLGGAAHRVARGNVGRGIVLGEGRRLRQAAAPAQVVDAGAPCYRDRPGERPRLAGVVRRGASPDLHECVLEELLGLADVADEAHGQGEKGGAVPRVEPAERVAVADAGLCQEAGLLDDGLVVRGGRHGFSGSGEGQGFFASGLDLSTDSILSAASIAAPRTTYSSTSSFCWRECGAYR